jgi:hypothetical protein
MRRSTIVALLVAGVLLVPLGVFAAHQFNDVPDSHTFHNAIGWMKDNNITVGCNPPANTSYCPDDNVTRGQMAAFMRRLAENNVVDAATLDGIDSTGFIETADAAAYTTQINGVACEGTSDCAGGAAVAVVPVLSLDVNAPTAGVMQISFLHQNDGGASFDFVQTWIAVDKTANGGCGTWFFAPGQNVPGTYAISWQGGADVVGGTNSGSAAVNIGGGDHTVVLCATGSDAFTSQQGSISTVWSQVGSGGAITGEVALSDAELAAIGDALGDAAPTG